MLETKRHHTSPSPTNKEFVFGIQSVIEAIKSGQEIDKILVQRELGMAEVVKLAEEREIPVQRVPLEKLNRISRKNHQGVMGFIAAINYVQLHNVVSGIFEKGETPLLLLLDRITDVRNFGAIARSAECMGVHALIVPSRGAAQINSDALKTSSGALTHLPVCREVNFFNTVRYLQESGIQIIACTEKTNQATFEIDFKVPTAILIGSEEDGISPDLLRKVDALAKIPMSGKVESLNVSVATGMILYEAQRQRLVKV